MKAISKYFQFVKFHHSIFAFPFLLGGILLAPNWQLVSLRSWIAIIVAMVTARNSAMGFNRIVDSIIDAKNPRTRNREIPSGKISKKQAILFVILNSIIFIAAAYFINQFTFIASFFVLFLLFSYSYMKRFTWACHYFLGFVIGLAPSAGWVAISGTISLPPFLLSGALMFYIAGFDLLYSTQDIEFDKKENLHSIPSRFGIEKALVIAKVTHVISFIFFILVGRAFQLNAVYWAGIMIIGILMILEQTMVKKDNLSKVPIAFFHVNSVISILVGISLAGGVLIKF